VSGLWRAGSSGRHDAESVRDAIVTTLGALPPHLRMTLTWDRGSEMARHQETADALRDTRIYFCDPHSPWQRGTNEHTNGMLRDYFPKRTDLSLYTAYTILDFGEHALPLGTPHN
jgi:IS30 family transposase